VPFVLIVIWLLVDGLVTASATPLPDAVPMIASRVHHRWDRSIDPQHRVRGAISLQPLKATEEEPI